jgi:hypothetical protein
MPPPSVVPPADRPDTVNVNTGADGLAVDLSELERMAHETLMTDPNSIGR